MSYSRNTAAKPVVPLQQIVYQTKHRCAQCSLRRGVTTDVIVMGCGNRFPVHSLPIEFPL